MPDQPPRPETPPELPSTQKTPARPMKAVSQPNHPPEKPKRAPGSGRRNPAYFPLWSVALMLMGVCGLVACAVGVVFSLGGRTFPAGGGQYVIITLPADVGLQATAQPQISPSLPELFNPAGTLPAFALQGPTLEAVVISPTPESIGVGKNVIVTAEDSGLNVRAGPGTENERLFIAQAGQVFTIIGGPAQANGFTWWQIQNPFEPQQQGWAAGIFLEIVPAAGAPAPVPGA